MKNTGRKLIVAFIIMSLVMGALAVPAQLEAKSQYWLMGVSKAAGGNMKMYYKGNTIWLKGKLRKSTSRIKLFDVAEKKCTYKLKVAGNCKVTLVEAENNQTMSYKKWVKNNGLKKGDEVSCIEADFKVVGKKITRIYFSA